MDGTNGGTSFGDQSAVIKGSGSAKTITTTGFITSTAQSKFYGSSGYSDTNYNSLTVSTSADFTFGTGDFTIESWIYPISIAGGYGIIFQTAGSNTVGSAYIYLNSSNNIVIETYDGSARPTVSRSGVVINAWNHVVIQRSSGTCTIFLNGIAGTSGSFTQSLTSTTPRIGSNSDESGNGRFNGYFQDLRVYKGVAKYTGNFNPVNPTNSFYLQFADNSSNTASTLGKDTSGLGNNWTPNNFSVTAGAGNDSLVDSPTNYGTDTGVGGEVRGNYCTLNPLDTGGGSLANGNLEWTMLSGTSINIRATMAFPATGKWYFECVSVGIGNQSYGITSGNTVLTG
ncbi:MAG: LamG domain-containing protein, partial [Caulobacteraceae bacterium]|nr:LamG domain-containing protein [Caulobacteraceae bacterium]